jgi:hypothetical protein
MPRECFRSSLGEAAAEREKLDDPSSLCSVLSCRATPWRTIVMDRWKVYARREMCTKGL